MNVGDSVRKAIDDWEAGELDASMLHACNAIDGTAKKLLPSDGSNARFGRVLRDNYNIFGPMALPGIDLVETRWPVKVARPKAAGGLPDVADVVYGIHRCTHGHGDELPDGFELLPDVARQDRSTRCQIEKGKVRLSDRTIFALLAVAVLSPVNIDQKVPDDYVLTFDGVPFSINDWWGRLSDFVPIVAKVSIPHVKLDFGDWMDVTR